MKTGLGYIMARNGRILYIGITSDLERRVWQHKTGHFGGFTSQYECYALVYVTDFADIGDAIARERACKGKSRAKKLELVESQNPRWNDLAWDWYEGVEAIRRDVTAARARGDEL